jgi:hypothetical protein
MTTAFVISAASTAVDVAVFLAFLVFWNRRVRRLPDLRYLYVSSGTNRAHRPRALR